MPTPDPLAHLVDAIHATDPDATAAAWQRQHALTKPQGALGMLETVGARLAGSAGTSPPPYPGPAAVAVFAGDHGVHAQGVTHWPQAVTAQMVENLTAGGAVVNALARQVGASVVVVDVGVREPVPDAPALRRRRVREGTDDLSVGPAMSRDDAVAALLVGASTADELIDAGARLLIAGEMGIANTTPSAALVCALTGADPAVVTGRGTGIDDATLRLKVDVVRRALTLHADRLTDPLEALAAVGGLEHAAIAGFLLGAAARRVPVILDGVTIGAAALVARALAPTAVDHWFAGHRSVEPGATVALEALGLDPLIDAAMRLGEGSGAVLAVPLVQAAATVLREVATFGDAGVSEAT